MAVIIVEVIYTDNSKGFIDLIVCKILDVDG